MSALHECNDVIRRFSIHYGEAHVRLDLFKMAMIKRANAGASLDEGFDGCSTENAMHLLHLSHLWCDPVPQTLPGLWNR